MVYFFKSIADPSFTLYMGKNKDENETLIKYMWPEDVWFHVDDMSSAHVYLRLQPGQGLDDIPPKVLVECCQLVKANSIKGNKLDGVTVIYTMHENLRKTPQMVAGEVGFHDEGAVRKVKVGKRDGPLLRKLAKTKEERHPNLKKDREDRDREAKLKLDHERKQTAKRIAAEKKAAKKKQREEQAKREYRDLFAAEETPTNKDMSTMTAQQYEEEEFW